MEADKPGVVRVGGHDVVSARMPTPDECHRLGFTKDTPMISVRRDGQAEQLFDSGLVVVIGTE